MTFRFENLVLDPARRELSRGGAIAPVEPRVFDLLVYLIESRDRVVSKEDLIAHVWGGRIVSDSAMTVAINAARQAVGDNGREQRLIRTFARKGVRFVGTIVDGQQGVVAPALPDKPSIAVLPFTNMSDDPGQDYFADGIVDDIIAALARFKSLFVIARNSSFTYKGKAVDIRQVGRELGVRYVLEGSVRKSNARIRVAGQLLDSRTGNHLWAARFDGALEDVFDLQDRVAAAVAGRLPLTIEQAEIDRLGTRPTASPGAYDSYLLAMRGLHRSTRDSVEEAIRHYYRAIELDPAFAEPHAWAAIAYSRRKQGRWMRDLHAESAEGVRLARLGAELRPDSALTLGAAGFALAFLGGDVAAGIDFIDRALALNPNDALVWHASGWIRGYNGDHDLAIEHIEHAERLSPLDPQTSQFALAKCMAHYCAGRYEAAVEIAQSVVKRHPELVAGYIHLAPSTAMAGRPGEARQVMARALALNPDLKVSQNVEIAVMRRRDDSERLKQGDRLAGMPE